jgi:excinuclease ABC subunit A
MHIKIKNAYENNLKNIDLSLPKNKLIAFTGVSGSGKSTLALDTIQRECQRLYMESLGMTLNVGNKAKVDSISGLSPAISITQHQSNNNPRSTVGTITELALYLRILYSKMGKSRTLENSNQELSANHFSYNNPLGACPHCNGVGSVHTVNVETVIDMNKNISEFAIHGWDQAYVDRYGASLLAAAKHYNFQLDINQPISKYDSIQMDLLLYGVLSKEFSAHFPDIAPPKTVPEGRFEGVVTNLLRRYSQQNISPQQKRKLEQFFSQSECPVCNGVKWNKEILDVYVAEDNIRTVLKKSLSELLEWTLYLEDFIDDETRILIGQLLETIKQKTTSLIDVGVEYLTLEQTAGTLSSGEWQRIKLASVINNGLTGVLYVLDEPSAGLHYSDISKLILVLKKLRDLGNTVIVIEHNLEIIKNVDHIVDFGPEAGKNGGEIIAQGSQKDIRNNNISLTGKYLNAPFSSLITKKVEFKRCLEISHANENNLKDITTKIPLDSFVTVTGVSGSGKTSLVFNVIADLAEKYFKSNRKQENQVVKGFDQLEDVVVINHNSVGRSSRSNIATYTDIFNDIRNIFSNISDEFTAKDFSTNTVGGRCEDCQGQGFISIPMHFLPDVEMTCPVCQGKRYKQNVLKVEYQGNSISDILSMDIKQAKEVFRGNKKIFNKLSILDEIGLGYLILGQTTATLSGGEAQRVKLAKELMNQEKSNHLYLFDEPTTGLHQHDVFKVISILRKLVSQGNSVVVIEHNLSIISQADFILDMGIKGGYQGGQVIASGTPEEVLRSKNSITASVLRGIK